MCFTAYLDEWCKEMDELLKEGYSIEYLLEKQAEEEYLRIKDM